MRTNRKVKRNRAQNKSRRDYSEIQPGMDKITNNLTIVRLPKVTILPSNIQTKCKFVQLNVINNAGAAKASNTFYVNGLYDVDPLLASTAIPGFSEMMDLYQNYRVIGGEVKARVTNNEAFPVGVACGFVPNPGVGSNQFAVQDFGNKWTDMRVLSAKGGQDRCTFIEKFNCENLFGSSAYSGDVGNFLGTKTTNPGTVLQWCVGLTASPVFVSGATLFLEIEFLVEWSNLRLFTS